MNSEQPPSPKFEEARQGLPADLQPIFEELVADYKFATTTCHGRGYVSYAVLAELVRVGWRFMGDPKKT